MRVRRLAALTALLLFGSSACTLPGQVTGPVELTATFDDVGDLVNGHSVQVADIRIGSVTGIDLTDDYRAVVTMRIKDGLELPADSIAVLRTTSLLGEKFIELRPPGEGDEGGEPARQAASAGDGDVLVDGDVIETTQEAPELEFVAEEAVQLLGGVAAGDLATLIETGAVGFGGRAAELSRLIDDFAVVSNTLADQTDEIVRIIDGLDRASQTLASNDSEVDQLLTTLATSTDELVAQRGRVLQTLEDLTRLAEAQNTLVFDPYRADLERQLRQLDQVVAVVAGQRQEVATLVDWLLQFTSKIPRGVAGDYAQVFGWFCTAPVNC